jgi:TolB-like protein
MNSGNAKYSLNLLGPFRLLAPDGQRVDISSKKGQALIAMLAVAGSGERTRSWLQTKLWGSRGADQAQASLRSELSALKNRISARGPSLLESDHSRIWITLRMADVDAREVSGVATAEFLEGLDIAGEEGFEDWLREERARREGRLAGAEPSRADAVLNAEPPRAAAAPVLEAQRFAALPAIAVLPFSNRTGDPALDYLAEGLSEDLIDRLSRLRWLPVIARSSSFAKGEAALEMSEIAEKLGARYLLEGNLRRSGAGDTLSLSMTDNDAGRIIWSNRIVLEVNAPTNVIEAMLNDISAHLGSHIDVAEQRRAMDKQQSDLNVRDLIWRGRWHLNRLTPDDAAQANALFKQALEREPNSPEALIQYCWALLWAGWAKRITEEETREIRRLAQKAIIADYEDARGHMLAGIAETWLRQPLRAEALLKRAIELNPSLALAHAQLGGTLYLRGEPEAAIEPLDIAVRLSPNDQQLFFFRGELAISHLMLENYEEALMQATQSLSRRAAYWLSHVVRINALARMERGAVGHECDLSDAVEEFHRNCPKFKVEMIDWVPFIDRHWNAFLKEGLNLASARAD